MTPLEARCQHFVLVAWVSEHTEYYSSNSYFFKLSLQQFFLHLTMSSSILLLSAQLYSEVNTTGYICTSVTVSLELMSRSASEI